MTDRRSGKSGHLSDDDRKLWERVARTAKPLRADKPPRNHAKPADATDGSEKPAKPAPEKRKSAPGRIVKPVAPSPSQSQFPSPSPATPELAGLDRRTYKRLSRGALPIDARIDLHGLTQRAAHTRLFGFLRSAQADGARLVLVITGKGARTYRDDGRFDSQPGVLRRAVPEWLGTPEFRPYVSGCESAGRTHGGEGAFYVRIRRPGTGGGT